jgi:hypothetical protein
MQRHAAAKTSLTLFAALLTIAGASSHAYAQEGEARPGATVPPLAMKVEWVRPADQADTKKRYVPVQENIADANVLITYYGAGAKQVLTTGAPGSATVPYGIWSGTAETPFAMTFKLKNGNYMDLTGLAGIKWWTKTSAFHVVRPVVKVGGTLFVGDVGFASVTKLTASEFSLTNVRWIKLDPMKLVTLNSGRAAANPNGDIWAPNVDLSKVEEFGFVDLMPGSGHGTGGWIQLGDIEVFAKTVARN